jgi:hypothetical protein
MGVWEHPKCVDLAVGSLILWGQGGGGSGSMFSFILPGARNVVILVLGFFSRSASVQLNCGIDLEIWRQLK